MKRYRKIQPTEQVQAVMFTGLSIDLPDGYKFTYAIETTDYHDDPQPLEPDDWIVIGDGWVTVMTDHDFAKSYEAV